MQALKCSTRLEQTSAVVSTLSTASSRRSHKEQAAMFLAASALMGFRA